MDNWREYVDAHYQPGTYGSIRLAKETGVPRSTVRNHISRRGLGRQTHATETPRADVLTLLRRGVTIEALMESTGQSERVSRAAIEDARDAGYVIDEQDDYFKIASILDRTHVNRISREWTGDKIIRFGLCGDNQDNSKYTQITHLHSFYNLCAAEGISDVYHTGDIDDGEQMRPGHQYECYAQGADDHVKNIIKNYPCRHGIKTHFITGNHDHSIIKRVGCDIGFQITAQRSDMVYLGPSSAIVELTPHCTLELRHPIDGTAYAISYKIQKMIEAMTGGEKPSILAVGHYHKAEYIPYRNVHAVQTGCFQAQTPWMRGKGIAAMMGGWIIEIHVSDDGEITSFAPRLIPFYEAIKDDWKNYA